MARNPLRRRSNKRLLVEVNLLPFIDIILVLLVIFMITAPLAIQGIDVNLPEASNEPLETTGKELVISYTHNKVFILEDIQSGGASSGQPLKLEQLVKQIEVLTANQPNSSLSFRADKNLKYEDITHAISQLNQAGITKISLITQPYDSKTD